MFRYQSVSSDWKNVKKHLEIVGTRRFLTNREMARLVRRWVDMVTYPSQTRGIIEIGSLELFGGAEYGNL